MSTADEVLPGLWLGNRGAALSQEFLKRNSIRAVFNFSKDIPFTELPVAKFRIPVDDNLQAEEIRNLELWSSEFVPRIMDEWRKGAVLLHCHAGMQRSAAAAAMVVMAFTHTNAETAMAYVRVKRPIAFTPAANFRQAILGVQRYLEDRWTKEARLE